MPALVLVCDDQFAIRRLVQEVLRQAGFRVALAATGGEALAVAAEQAPDLVILDLLLPDLEGPEVLARLRAGRPGLPVVVITAAGEAAHVQGVAAVLAKPFDIYRLLALVQELLGAPGAPHS